MELPKIQIDPNSDEQLLQQALIRTQEASGGVLNDFSSSSPVNALLSGTVYAVAELLYYCNMLPEATALEVFRNYGVTRREGTNATGSITILLEVPLTSNFILSKGYLVTYGEVSYITLEDLVILPGNLEGSVPVSSTTYGSVTNVPKYGILDNSVGLSYVKAIYNPLEISGGTDLESIEDTISRGATQVRTKGVLVSKEDYEKYVERYLGGLARCFCVPLLGADKISKKPGQVHLFLIDALGKPANSSTCNLVKLDISNRTFVSSDTWVSPVELRVVDLELVVEVQEASQVLADIIFDNLKKYLSTSSYVLGSTVRLQEIVYIVRATIGVNYVDSCLINKLDRNQALNTYELPVLQQVKILMMQPNKISYTYEYLEDNGDLDVV